MVANYKKIVNISSIAIISALVIFSCYLYNIGALHSVSSLQEYVNHFAIMGFVIFILIQITQVVIPIIPGGITTVAGVLLFGATKGFFLNYIGIVIGSILLFVICKTSGKDLASKMMGEKLYNKYKKYLEHKHYDTFFTLAIFFPIAPDDALIALSGIKGMGYKKFITIILLAKPLSIYLYSFALTYGISFLL